MADLQTVYSRLPAFLQNAACSIKGWQINRRRYNRRFYELLDQYTARENMPEADLAKWRDLQLHRFVLHAASTVPYYRRKFPEWGIDPNDIRTLDDLSKIPVLTKAEVQDHLTDLRSDICRSMPTMPVGTSGTTGTGLLFEATLESQSRQWAVWWRYRLSHGIELFEPCAVFGGQSIVPVGRNKPPFWRYNQPARQILFSGYHLRPENLAAYVDRIVHSGVRWIHGYPSHLAIIASCLLENGIDLTEQIQHVTTGAESLLAAQRDLLKQAFGGNVREHYGLAEGVANISECPHGNLHVDEDFSAVEFQPRGNDLFKLVGTNFTNPAFPLLRYDTGDVVRCVDDGTVCGCGRRGRVVGSIDGRIEDYILLADGTRVGRMDHILKKMTHIREAQFYQREPGKIQIRIVRRPEYSPADEKRLLDQTALRVGSDTEVTLEYRDRLPRTSRGKLRLVVSEIDDARIDV